MNHKFEILAPGGDLYCIKAGIVAGAGAIYCGLRKFNARTSATNISFDELVGITTLAHQHNCQIFLTLNILILEQEVPDLIRLLNRLVNTKIDAVIVQDLGLFYILSKYFKSLVVHASTQAVTHNCGQIDFLNQLGVSRVNLARELNIEQITNLTHHAHGGKMETEVFVHGSYCIGFSGICYYSSVHFGHSGNRGQCAQPCRDQFKPTAVDMNFPLNLKDNSAFFDLKELEHAEVDSLKIEGRIKKADYVYATVSSWKQQIAHLSNTGELLADNTQLFKVFNRDFSNGFLKNTLSRNMFIDNPRSYTNAHFIAMDNATTESGVNQVKDRLHAEKTEAFAEIQSLTKDMSIDKSELSLSFSGGEGEVLTIAVRTPDHSFTVRSRSPLMTADKYILNIETILKRFASLSGGEYLTPSIDTKKLSSGIFISFKEQRSLRNEISILLNGGVNLIPPVELPKLQAFKSIATKAKLSVLISELTDLDLLKNSSADFFFELPESFGNRYNEMLSLFQSNSKLIPWFPSLLIGEDFVTACKLLDDLRPEVIVTNNLGVAHHAFKLKVKWLAGPFLNITNSYSMKCLAEEFGCSGSFVSNEIKKNQIGWLKPPLNFKQYYSIFHPITLMTSKQCLFLTTSGCLKNEMDGECLRSCRKSTVIENMKGDSFYIDKRVGSSNNLYSAEHFLNTSIPSDIPGQFTSFLIDLRNIKTSTVVEVSKSDFLTLFEKLLDGRVEDQNKLLNAIQFTTSTQYKKGL